MQGLPHTSGRAFEQSQETFAESTPRSKPRSFAEFILSRTSRSFASLRMTEGEGLR